MSSQRQNPARHSRGGGAPQPNPPPTFTNGQPPTPAPGVPPNGAPDRHPTAWFLARRQDEVERPNTSDNPHELLAEFMNCTETDAQLAVQYLRNNHWDLEVALEEYWKAVYPESSDDELSSLASGNGGSWESSVEGESEVERQFPAPASVNSNKRKYTDENPNVDRSPAVRGHRDDSKLTITLMRNGKPLVSGYKEAVNWDDAQSVHTLNRFRQQIFRRNLDTVRPAAIRYHRDEDQYLVDVHREAVRAQERQGGRSRLNWETITNDFNARFQGQILEGSDVPRRARTKGSLQSQSNRIDEICRITGRVSRAKPKTTKPANNGKRSPEPDDEEAGTDE